MADAGVEIGILGFKDAKLHRFKFPNVKLFEVSNFQNREFLNDCSGTCVSKHSRFV